MPSARLACLFVPLFPLAARLRSEPDLKVEALAVFEGNGNAARVVAAARKAREKGIQPGMTLPPVILSSEAASPVILRSDLSSEAHCAKEEATKVLPQYQSQISNFLSPATSSPSPKKSPYRCASASRTPSSRRASPRDSPARPPSCPKGKSNSS